MRFGWCALLAASIALGGCGAVEDVFVGHGCTDSHSETVTLTEPTDPATTLKIEDCRMDSGACDSLCALELGTFDFSETLTGCQVTFQGSATHIEIDYDTQADGPGCSSGPIFDDGGEPV